METLLDLYPYWAAIALMMMGLYIIISSANLMKKLLGINIFQVSLFILFISTGYVDGGTAPIYSESYSQYASPLPHVLILTAIVVSIATTAVGLALVMRIYIAYGSIDENILHKMDDIK